VYLSAPLAAESNESSQTFDPSSSDSSAPSQSGSPGDIVVTPSFVGHLTVYEGDTVVLSSAEGVGNQFSGSASVQWAQLSGPRVELNLAQSASAWFVAPAVEADAVLLFQVSVNQDGRVTTGTVEVVVLNVVAPAPAEPALQIVASTSVGPVPLQVTFAASAGEGQSLPDGEYSWDFGDGATAKGPETVHVFDAAGTYAVRLCVAADGGRVPSCATVSIVAQPPSFPGGGGGAVAIPPPPPAHTYLSRTPQWPLKTSRVLLSDAQISQARVLCQTDLGGVALRQAAVAAAAYWVAMSDQQLHDLLPDARVPRDIDVSIAGCPRHGTTVYQYGAYPWILDREHPFRITCPIGGETYPSNDFEAYYRDGMRNPAMLTGDYPDSGSGWTAPDGQVYRMVGYACLWNWRQMWLPAVTTLSQAYVMTGDRTYARKAIVMLDRIAEIYPEMDFGTQSRAGVLAHGGIRGKILDQIWETWTVRDLAIAYDLVFDALIGPDPVSLPWRSAEEIRANIEANLLEEAIDAIGRGAIQGNFGMHQSALAYAAVVRQNGPTGMLLDGILAHTGGLAVEEGFNYAWYNLVFKDGMPYETSPTYCFSWVTNFTRAAQPLSVAGRDLYAEPRMRLMLDAPLQLICTGEFTPGLGDAGRPDAGWLGPVASTYEDAYRYVSSPPAEYAWAVKRLRGLINNYAETFDDLTAGESPQTLAQSMNAAVQGYVRQPRSRLLDGYGLAILNNARDTLALSMYYGIRGGHGHCDRLGIELFGYGRRLSPDPGKPDFTNGYCSGRFSWTNNTISHNCVVVDDRKQLGNRPGVVLRFHDTPTVHVADVDAPGSYDQASRYRRTLVLVDTGDDDSYLVDVFRIQGGTHHVLSIHGAEGTFEFVGAALPPPVTQGTLAGPDVAYGELYDDPILGAPGFSGSYTSYSGSGYQHLFNWQRVTPTTITTGHWILSGDSAPELRVHVLPQDGQDLVVADAYVSPLQTIPTMYKYLLAERTADAGGTTFVAVWEPTAAGGRLIDRIETHEDPSLGVGHDRIVALSVYRQNTVDRILVSPAAGRSCTVPGVTPALVSDAAVAVISESGGVRTRTFAAGGTVLTGSAPVAIPATIIGVIRTTDYAGKTITVQLPAAPTGVNSLPGSRVRIFNDAHSCVYTIDQAQANGESLILGLSGSDVFTGRIKVQSVDAGSLAVLTNTAILYPDNLAGMHLVTSQLDYAALIASMTGTAIRLSDGSETAPFVVGADAWIADFGAGDHIEIERHVYQSAM